jgi:hypothetical protein
MLASLTQSLRHPWTGQPGDAQAHGSPVKVAKVSQPQLQYYLADCFNPSSSLLKKCKTHPLDIS